MEKRWRNSRHSTRNVGCGGLWCNMVEENGTKYPLFSVPFSPFSRRSRIFPAVRFVKNQLTEHTDRELGISATPRHSTPPRRLVGMLDIVPRGQSDDLAAVGHTYDGMTDGLSLVLVYAEAGWAQVSPQPPPCPSPTHRLSAHVTHNV